MGVPAPRIPLSPQALPLAALEGPARRRRMFVVVNPHAAGVDARVRALVVAGLSRRFDVEAADTEAPGHATGLAGAAARDGAEIVVTLGGDGTLNEAAGGLLGTGVPLFPLPGGSQNVYAKILAIPADLVDAAEHLLHLADAWRTRTVDVGRVGGRIFTFSAGAGLDAAVVQRVDADPARKARWRELAYMQAATVVFLRDYAVRAPRLIVEAPGQEPVEGMTVIVQNATPYTFAGRRRIDVCDGVDLESGTLSAAVMRRTGPLDLPAMGARLWFAGLDVTGHRHVTAFEGCAGLSVRRVDGTPFVVQVDGDALEPAPSAQFEVLPGALTVAA